MKNHSVLQKLDEVMKLELIEDKTSDEIAEIWKAHFATQNALSAVIPRETYAQMKERFEKFNTVGKFISLILENNPDAVFSSCFRFPGKTVTNFSWSNSADTRPISRLSSTFKLSEKTPPSASPWSTTRTWPAKRVSSSCLASTTINF